jgi:hypothetical protein
MHLGRVENTSQDLSTTLKKNNEKKKKKLKTKK